MALTPNILFHIIFVLFEIFIIILGLISIVMLFIYCIRLLISCMCDEYEDILIRMIPALFLSFIFLFFLNGLYFLITKAF